MEIHSRSTGALTVVEVTAQRVSGVTWTAGRLQGTRIFPRRLAALGQREFDEYIVAERAFLHLQYTPRDLYVSGKL